MRVDQVASIALSQIFKRVMIRALLAAVLGLFALIAVYHFTVAGDLALQAQFGALYARLIIAGIYTALAGLAFLTLWLTRAKPAKPRSMPRARLRSSHSWKRRWSVIRWPAKANEPANF
jgi:hypothetical protein